jgi:hypothetical protein
MTYLHILQIVSITILWATTVIAALNSPVKPQAVKGCRLGGLLFVLSLSLAFLGAVADHHRALLFHAALLCFSLSVFVASCWVLWCTIRRLIDKGYFKD